MTIQKLKEQINRLLKEAQIEAAIETLINWATDNNNQDILKASQQVLQELAAADTPLSPATLETIKEHIVNILKKPYKNTFKVTPAALSQPPTETSGAALELDDIQPASIAPAPPPPIIPIESIRENAAVKMPTIPAPQPLSENTPLQGGLLYNIPPKMPQGVETKCIIRIAFDKKLLKNALDVNQSTVELDIRVAELMEVELKELGNNGAFEITALNDRQQFLDGFSATEWQFYVKPIKTGSFKLLLKVAIIERINNVDRRKEAVLEQAVTVITEGGIIPTAEMKTFTPQFQEAANAIKTILFMGANPPGTTKVNLEIEHSRIVTELDGKFKLPVAKFVNVSDMNKLILKNRPNIIHFSGHGKEPEESISAEGSTTRGVLGYSLPKNYEKSGGIVVFDEDMRGMKVIDDKALQFLFKAITQQFKIPLEVVVFNSCHSESQAQAIGMYIPYVVGTAHAIRDTTAIAFATGFYFGLASGMSVEDAFTSGKINAVLEDTDAENLIVLYENGKKKL